MVAFAAIGPASRPTAKIARTAFFMVFALVFRGASALLTLRARFMPKNVKSVQLSIVTPGDWALDKPERRRM